MATLTVDQITIQDVTYRCWYVDPDHPTAETDQVVPADQPAKRGWYRYMSALVKVYTREVVDGQEVLREIVGSDLSTLKEKHDFEPFVDDEEYLPDEHGLNGPELSATLSAVGTWLSQVYAGWSVILDRDIYNF